jgi:hypothetical protein
MAMCFLATRLDKTRARRGAQGATPHAWISPSHDLIRMLSPVQIRTEVYLPLPPPSVPELEWALLQGVICESLKMLRRALSSRIRAAMTVFMLSASPCPRRPRPPASTATPRGDGDVLVHDGPGGVHDGLDGLLRPSLSARPFRASGADDDLDSLDSLDSTSSLPSDTSMVRNSMHLSLSALLCGCQFSPQCVSCCCALKWRTMDARLVD